MIRTLTSSMAALLLFAGTAAAETTPPDKPGTPKTDKPATPPKTAKPETPSKTQKTTAKVNRVSYSCEGGVSMTVTYPPEAQAKTKPVKIAMKDTTYFVRPAGEKYENTKIKLVFQAKGDEASLEREGKPLAEKCKAAKPGT